MANKIKDSKETIIQNIINKFGDSFNVKEKEIESPTSKSYAELNITKYTMCNINITIQIYIYSHWCEVYIADKKGIRKICTENYLSEISKFITTVLSNINTYMDFIHSILDHLDNDENNDTKYSVYDEYLMNSDGEFYLKKSGKIIKIYPIYSLDTYKAMENYEPLYVVPVCGFNENVKLMRIFPKSANIGDTADALLFFLE